MDVYAAFHRRTAGLFARLAACGALPSDLDVGRITVAPPPPFVACDLAIDASPAALRNAGSRGIAPWTVARALASVLADDSDVAAVEVARPGFVNVTLKPAYKAAAVAAVLRWPSHGARTTADASRWRADLSLAQGRAIAVADALARLHASSPSVAAPRPVLCGPVSACHGSRSSCTVIRAVGVLAAIDDIGLDALLFALTAGRPDAALVLDLDELAERSRANPPFWIRYAHARARSTLRSALSKAPDLDLSPAALAEADLARLRDPTDLAVMREILRFPHVLAIAAAAQSLRRLAAHLGDLASAVHSQWNRSKDQPQLRFVNAEQGDLQKARLALVTASARILETGLGILGVTAPDEMC